MRAFSRNLAFLLAVVLTMLAARAVADDAQSHLAKAKDFAADYKMQKALDEAHKALALDPSLAEAHVIVGLVPLRARDWKTAQDEFQKAMEIDPYLASAHCYLGWVMLETGDTDSAIDQFNLALKLDTTSPQIYAGIAIAQYRQGKKDDAIRTFSKAARYDKRFTDPKFLANENGPKWAGKTLDDAEAIIPHVENNSLY
jgi:tetratricopeptide (TPR) repeat protein